MQFLLDCGLYQGSRREAFERNRFLPVDPDKVDAVILSHAHIDHSGNLPSMVRAGYCGPIYTTPATVDLCLAMLADSAFIQEKDADYCNRRRGRRRKIGRDDAECSPLYTMEDAEKTFERFVPVPLGEDRSIGDGVTYHTYDAGHMLGSTSVVVNADGTRLCFSGDVGRRDLPILRDPHPPDERVDYLIMESTYGGRFHAPEEDASEKLADVVNRTVNRGGRIIVPAFAVGRTQQLVYLLHKLILANRIPEIPMFVDSPLAINATEVFRKHPECYDAEIREFLKEGQDPFGFHRLKYTREVNESKALNDMREPFLVLAASGMCEAGRILHHLKNNIENPRNTVLITGYQAEHTLGRKMLEGHAEVSIFGEPMRLRAEVDVINDLSGHADHGELLEWMRPMSRNLKRVFLVHGEEKPASKLAVSIEDEFNIDVVIPSRGQTFHLD